jgi:magnesium transporter
MPSLPIPGSLRPRVPRRRASKATLPWIPQVDRSTAIVDCAVYRDGQRQPGDTTWREAIDDVERAGTGFFWVGLHEPSERQLAGLAERLKLHPLAVEDAVVAHQRPKLERYDNSLFAVVKTVHYNDDGRQITEVVETGEVMIFLAKNFVVTVRHGEHSGLHRLRKMLEATPELIELGPAAVLHAIMDRAVDQYTAVAKKLQNDIDQVEEMVFAGLNRAAEGNRIYLPSAKWWSCAARLSRWPSLCISWRPPRWNAFPRPHAHTSGTSRTTSPRSSSGCRHSTSC